MRSEEGSDWKGGSGATAFGVGSGGEEVSGPDTKSTSAQLWSSADVEKSQWMGQEQSWEQQP